jgi:hypothetical protein
VKFNVKVDSLMYYNMSKFHFIILISQFMRAVLGRPTTFGSHCISLQQRLFQQ